MFRSGLHTWVLPWTLLALFGQVDSPRPPDSQQIRPGETAVSQLSTSEVTIEQLEVYERPDEGSYITGTLKHGDRVRVRRKAAGGWLAIDPPLVTLCWIEQSAIDPSPVPSKRVRWRR